MTTELPVSTADGGGRDEVGRRPVPGQPVAGQTPANRSRTWLLDQLPVAMLDVEFFTRFVSIFQRVGSTLLDDADNIDNLPDLSVTPTPAVRWLGSWIGVDSIDPSLPDGLQRSIVRSAAHTLGRRGTAGGLRDFLGLLTGGDADVREGGGVWRDGDAPRDTAWVVLRVATAGWLSEAEFVDLVQDEIPAHVRAELFIGERCVWRSEEGEGAR